MTVAIPLLERVSIYGSFIRGLENGPVAPSYAANGYEALRAVRARQLDAGMRWRFARDSSLILG